MCISNVLDSVTKPNPRSSSSTPRRIEHTSVNFSNIVNSLLVNNDGKGGAPSQAYSFS